MNFAYPGPFSPQLDSRVGRDFANSEPYSAEAGGFTVEAALRPEIVERIVEAFGRDGSKPRRRTRRKPAVKA